MQSIVNLDKYLTRQFVTFTSSDPFLTQLFVALGVGLIYVIPPLLIYAWFTKRQKIALQAAITGLIAWEVFSKIVAAIVDRPRPSMSQIGTKELIFHRPDTSFPSDHSAFLIAISFSFYLAGEKKLGHFCLSLAIIIGITRVGIGVHFPTDIVAGWAVGALTAGLIYLVRDHLEKYVTEPIVQLAKKMRL